MQIVLLTHEREIDRPSNTGRLALELAPHLCRRILWSRVAPDRELLATLASGQAKLLFPKQTAEVVEDGSHGTMADMQQALTAENMPEQLVILDATWQEARKMVRQSPYLKAAKTCYLNASQTSAYQLRRNQLEGGLCTVECVMAIAKLAGNHREAELLIKAYEFHNQRLSR